MSDTKYPATVTVHWPTGPVPACDRHASELLKLSNFLGSHVAVTGLSKPAECANCMSEAAVNK